jgi:hypothetical protein
MELARLFAQFVFACVAIIYLAILGIKTVQYASRGSAGAHVLGAALILMGFGNMQDPTMEMVAQAKQQKRSEEDDSGDPPEPGDENRGGA